MPREIVGKGLRFSLRHAPCAHICRYCLISESRKRSALPFARFEQLVHRFHDWRLSERPDLDIGVFVGPSFDYDIDTLKGFARLRERRGGKFQIINLGGLRIRRGDELIAWIEERRQAGIVGFHTSLAGYGETHDRWNGRTGDFDYQTAILRLGGEPAGEANQDRREGGQPWPLRYVPRSRFHGRCSPTSCRWSSGSGQHPRPHERRVVRY
jgi:hypothetical protein